MDGPIKIIAALSALLIASIRHTGDCDNFTYSLGAAVLLCSVGLYVKDRLGILFSAFFIYISVHSISSATNIYGRYSGLPFQVQNAISINGMFSFLYLFLVLIGVLLLRRDHKEYLIRAIPFYCVSNAVFVLFEIANKDFLGGGHGWQGFLCYSGMNGCLMALGIPFLFPVKEELPITKTLKIFLMFLILIGVYFSNSAIPYWLIAASVLAKITDSFKKINYRYLVIPFVALLAGVITQGATIVNSAGRFHVYKIFLKWIYRKGLLTLGTCIGGVKVFGPTIQLENNFMLSDKGGWFWDKLHSDLVQAWFMWGWPAAVLLVLVYAQALYRCRVSGRHDFFAFGIGIGVMGLVNYPHWYFPTAFLSTLFLVDSLDTKKIENTQTYH